MPHAFRPLALAFALAACFGPDAARAQPSGAQVVHGSAVFVRNGSSLTVTTRNGAGTNHSAIDWQSFGVPVGSTTWFLQPGAASTSINRVMGPDPSAIHGRLGSNGKLVLVNPAGIAVGPGAVVDTGGFTASTLRMSDADAAAGRLRFAGDANAGPLSVQGQVLARSGDVVLIAPRIDTGATAVVESRGGATILAAGQSVAITGRGLEGIHFDVKAGNEAVNLGTLKGDAVGIFANTLRHSGLVTARTTANEGGKVVLLAGDITVGPGGKVDASGDHRGGTILVGGEQRGAPAKRGQRNAQFVELAPGSTVRADALQKGNGGRVIVWAEQWAGVHGMLSARGGPAGGNGGFVETSARVLDVTRGADVSAHRGRAGKWLIDPEDVDIDAVDDNVETSGARRRPKEPRPGKISARAIEDALDAGGTVEISTEDGGPHGNGTIRIRKAITKSSEKDSTLSLQANRDIEINAAVKSISGKLNFVLDADSDRDGVGATTIAADIDTRGGTLTAPEGAPSIGLGRIGAPGALSIRARLAGHRYAIHQDLCDSDLVVESGQLTWWGGTSLVKSALATLPGARLDLSNQPESTGTHRLSHSELWNFGTLVFADGAGDLVVDNGSSVNNVSFPTDEERARFFGRSASFGGVGLFGFRGNAVVRGSTGSFVNRGALVKGELFPGVEPVASLGPDTTTATIDATGIDVVLTPASTVLVTSGTLRLARSPTPSPTPFVNQGVVFIDQAATLSTEGHPLASTVDAVILGNGTLVTQHLRNAGILFPGGLAEDVGALTLVGNYTQESTGKLFVRVESPARHDRLVIRDGSVSLAGEILPLVLENAAFRTGDRFDIITGAARTSGAASVPAPARFDAGRQAGGLRLVARAGAGAPPAAAPTPAPASSPAPSHPPAPRPPSAAAPPAERIAAALGGQISVADAQQIVTVTDGTVSQNLGEPVPAAAKSLEKRDRGQPKDDGMTCR